MIEKQRMCLPGGLRLILATFALALVSACTLPEPGQVSPDGIFDPYEKQNRRVHNFNRKVDRSVLRPVSRGYARVVPEPVRVGISNFSDNLSMPQVMVNKLLQGKLRDGGMALVRFVTNTTLGFGGILDVADAVRMEDVDTDFGETLYVWGLPEGAYRETPFLGPTTERAAVGRVVDAFTNPLGYVLGRPERAVATASNIASRVGDRAQFGDTIDSVLYESTDSYAQSRSIYIQNRRFELGDTATNGSTDPYADPYLDPYVDPYEE